MKIIFMVTVLMILVSADQFVPIPKKAYGFSFGAPDGELHI